jgi:3-hydroxyethyl bacteriochlorophyllide a dehydrogenase
MDTTAVVFQAPGQIRLQALGLVPPDAPHALVDVAFSGISTGTERLLWKGEMPMFPGMGYPLVPGYETVGRIAKAPPGSGFAEGDMVFVPGATCYGPVRGLFGGAASRIAIDPSRLSKLDERLGEDATLLALAATAHHGVSLSRLPDLIIGHGILGRLMARLTMALGGKPVVWESQELRRNGAEGYVVTTSGDDTRKDYGTIIDASGDASIIDKAMPHLARKGEIILAGFYSKPLGFVFPPAFMREASLRIAAQWQPSDMAAVLGLVAAGQLSLSGLITHRMPAEAASEAYQTAFENPGCLKMVLDWRNLA